MATRTRKSQAATQPAQEEVTTIEQALDTPVERTLEDAADYLGVAPIRLQEMFCDRLSSNDPMAWLTIPLEYEPLLEAFKRDLDAENSVRRLDIPSEPAAQLSPVADIPELPEEMQIQKVDEHAKKEPTGLTQTKSEKLKESDQKAQQLASSDNQVKVKLHALKGQKSGAQLATIELAAEDLTYRKIKGEALVRKVGQLTSEIAAESDFDPIQLLAEFGIDSNSEIFEDLRQLLEPALGKLESATAEIVENAWVNGIDLEVELSQLENLLNSNELVADCWQ
jgi:hypothetical protein